MTAEKGALRRPDRSPNGVHSCTAAMPLAFGRYGGFFGHGALHRGDLSKTGKESRANSMIIVEVLVRT